MERQSNDCLSEAILDITTAQSQDPLLPPMQPILDSLRRKAAVDISVAYSEDGNELHGLATYRNKDNGPEGQLCGLQTMRVLWYIYQHGLMKLVNKLLPFGVAVNY